MDDGFKKIGACPRLLDLIPNKRDWMVKDSGGGGGGNGFRVAEEEKLELRLGPPGEESWSAVRDQREEQQSLESGLSICYFSKVSKSTTSNSSAGAKRVFQQQQPGFLKLQAKAGGKELTQKTNGRAELPSATPGNAAVAHTNSQTRTVSTPVVGWPPIRSFRRNLATSSSKSTQESQHGCLETATKIESSRKGLFVKINMDGIPIGRKVDLKAYDTYEKLCCAVDELFRGLLAAQRDPAAAGTKKLVEDKQVITDLLDGSGEYTLVYEDDEGDRMLVGDVPWEMFVSTAKRLRVLKTSELSALSLGTINRKRAATEC